MIFTPSEALRLNRERARAQIYRLNVARAVGIMPDHILREEARVDGSFAARMAQHELDRREDLER